MNKKKELLSFLKESPVAVYAISNVKQKLIAHGFKELKEQNTWSLKRGKYFVIRGDSSLLSFILPKNISTKSVFRIFAAHSDSPQLKIRSTSKAVKGNFLQLKVEPYGGLLSHTWFDRELALAGIVYTNKKGKLKKYLLNIKKPIGIIPNLAIHLNRELAKDGFKINNEKHLPVIVGLKTNKELELINFLARQINVNQKDILSYDLSFYDANEAKLGGLQNEFIFSSRLDDLLLLHAGLSSFTTVSSKFDSKHTGGKQKNKNKLFIPENTIIPVCVFFNHEEIGSVSSNGASSNFLTNMLERIAGQLSLNKEEYYAMQSRSTLISGDMAHALHPNYSEKHIEESNLHIGAGPVLKLNVNQRYSTSTRGEAEFVSLCKNLKIPYQIYKHRSDLACGSTIGPTVAASTGMTVIDSGNAMLAMHSIRETAGIKDYKYFIKLLNGFFTKENLS